MSEFVVSARKYRPLRFNDVVGQAHVSKTLKNALQTGKVAHAFLFCGPRGVGKTTCARILAKVLNCEHRTPDFEACNECPSCKSFQENASFNILELDAASNNSVENIRTLVDQVRILPQQGRYKIFIIDEVHMLSAQAFNAFLKTLEEPPPHVIFILATTEKQKILPTILSRCQIFDFRRIEAQDIADHLRYICTKEDIEADDEALQIIAQKADGALRDALSIFDRLVSATGGKVLYSSVLENLNILDYDYFFRAVDGFLTEDSTSIMLLFDEVLKKGFDPDNFLNGLAEHLRNLLVCQDEQTLVLLEVTGALRERYRQQATLASTSVLLTCLNLANECDVNYKMARHKRLHVEIALYKMTFCQRVINLTKTGVPQAAVEEKKNPELSKSAESAPSQPTIGGSKAPGEQKIPQQSPSKSVPLVKPISEFATPTLSLEKITAEVEAEAITTQEKIQNLTMDFLITLWQEYLTNNSSQMARAALSQTLVKYEGNQVMFNVPSAIAKTYLLQDIPMLRERILSDIHVPDLQLEVEIDPTMMPVNTATPKKPMTNKEKYEKMLEINPLLHEMRIRFDLKLDKE